MEYSLRFRQINMESVKHSVCMRTEPGGNRVELFGDTGYLIFDPAWKPVIWQMEDVPGNGDTWIGSAFRNPSGRTGRQLQSKKLSFKQAH